MTLDPRHRPACQDDRPGLLIGLLCAALATPATAAAQPIETQLEATTARYAEARALHLDIISPANFERASDRLARAQQKHRQGGRIDEIRELLDECNRALDRAEALRATVDEVMQGTLAARERALAAASPELEGERYEAAERKAREAGRKLEGGNRADARLRAAEAESLYREAQLEAVRRRVLGEARRRREEAIAARAVERAPRTLAHADSLLRRADALLAADPDRPAEAEGLATVAADEYGHSIRIAALSDSVRRGGVSAEMLVHRHENDLTGIAEAVGLQAAFAGGTGPVTAEIIAAILGLLEDRRRLEAGLADREEEIRRRAAASDSLDLELARLEEREAAVSSELRQRERRERTLREVEALFDQAEAEIVLGVGELTIRLLGLSFESGSDEVRPEDHSLLTKVQQAIRAFPEATITVEGHTDSQGDDGFNQALSTRRAIAVREHILANMAISADRIRSVGYGESRPIARNDTAAGRARNRRIDVVLALTDAS